MRAAMLATIVALGVSPGRGDWVPAADFLRHQVDYAHDRYYVYTDTAMPENHFPVLMYLLPPKMAEVYEAAEKAGRIPEKPPPITVSTLCGDTFYQGSECIRSEVTQGAYGACLQHGYMLDGDTIPRPNYGDQPDAADAATDLTGASHVLLHARGERGGEQVEFFIGGIGRDPVHPKKDKPPPDVPEVGTAVTLTRQWQLVTIKLPPGTKLDHVINGFGWWQRAAPNGPSVIYLDEIYYDLPRAREPRFPASFAVEDRRAPIDTVQRSFAHTYDSALSLITLLALGDERRARLIGEAFCEAQEHDPDGPRIDGALRNCYSAGDLFLPKGWAPTGIPGAIRLAGFWAYQTRTGVVIFTPSEPEDDVVWSWFQDQYANAVYVGNIAWAGIALLHLSQRTEEPKYMDAAARLGEWVIKHAQGPRGFSGGIKYWADAQQNRIQIPVEWVSTEHNLDCYVLFELLRARDGKRAEQWHAASAHAKAFVESMWDARAHHFWTGLKPNGELNRDFIPVDCQAWAVLGLRDPAYMSALDWAVENAEVPLEDRGWPGFAFRAVGGLPARHPARVIWPEGTAQMVCAFRQAKRPTDAQRYLGTLREIQRRLLKENKNGMVASAAEVLEAMPADEDGKHEYYRRQHLGATCWLILAEKACDPYWLTPLDGGD